jgi:hypothetical protein
MRSKSQHKKKGHTKELASMLRSLSFVKRASDKGEKVKSITLGLLPSPFGFTKELASMVCDSACRLGQAHTSNMLLFTYHFIFLHWHFVSPVTQLIQKFLKKNRQLIQKLPPGSSASRPSWSRWIRPVDSRDTNIVKQNTTSVIDGERGQKKGARHVLSAVSKIVKRRLKPDSAQIHQNQTQVQ